MSWVGASLSIAFVLAASAHAQNLLVNGDLDADASGWAPINGNISLAWDAADPDDPTPSGSLRVQSVIPNAASGGAKQCIPLAAPSPPLDARTQAFVPVQTQNVGASFYAYFYDDGACSGTLLDTPFSAFMFEQAAWRPIEDTLAPPATAQSVMFVLAVTKELGPEPASVLFDAVFLPEPGGVATALAAAGAVAVARARRR